MNFRVLFAAGLAATSLAASALPVSLSGWSTSNSASLSGQPNGSWQTTATGVRQLNNGQPSLYLSGSPSGSLHITGQFRTTNSDDDFMGFAFGVGAGDWLLIDWKKANQTHDFTGGAASITSGSTARRGLAASLVTGTPTADEFWGHYNHAAHTAGGLSELARGSSLGNAAYVQSRWYNFDALVLADRVDFSIDNVLQFSVNGQFNDGRWGFYNFSQPSTEYRNLQANAVPLPATLGLALGGLGLLALRRRRA